MTYRITVLLPLTVAGAALPIVATRGGFRTQPGRTVHPVSRRPVRAEVELATNRREASAAELPASAFGRRWVGPRTEPALRDMPPAAGGLRSMFGYASLEAEGGVNASDFRSQAEQIASACDRIGVELFELVREREPRRGRALDRPGLGYALESISAGEADGLVVADLSRLTRSAAELGRVLQWFTDQNARLIAVSQGLDTRQESGRLAVRTIIEVSRWEHERLVERTRNGMLAARRKGPPGVADYPHLKERIARMRADGMTLEAIAGQLNREGTPTVRGGAKWRPSSVQVAAGYRRPPAGPRNRVHRHGGGPKPSEGKL